MSQPQQHPEDLLAEYVEGSLDPADRERVESHVAACATCREEVELAGSARHALESLPELDVPAGTTWPVVERARLGRRWLPGRISPRAAWVAAGTAAAAAAVIGAFALVGGPGEGVGGPGVLAPGMEAEAPEPRPAEESLQGESDAAERTYPFFEQSERDHDAESLPLLAQDLTIQARVALEEGYPEPPAQYYVRALLTSLPDRTRRALSCVATAVSPDRSLAPFSVLAATFEEEPVYIGVFLQADAPDRPYDQLTLYVVSREDCALKSFARQRL